MSTARRISDIAPADVVFPRALSPADVRDTELYLDGFTFSDGKFGEFAVLRCRKVETDEKVVVATGAQPVMQQLHALGDDPGLPLKMRFTPRNRSWILE